MALKFFCLTFFIFVVVIKNMCESNVYIKEGDKEELFYKEAIRIIPTGENEFVVEGLMGERKKISGVITEINLIGHKIIFEKK